LLKEVTLIIITYENPNEKLGENVTLIEEGEYRCRQCNNLIALYRNSTIYSKYYFLKSFIAKSIGASLALYLVSNFS
jgi:hypothetical protein